MRKSLKQFGTFATILAGSAILAGAANAASIIGLVDGKTIVMIDPQSRAVTSSASIAGAASILGIDVRPADGAVYGLAADGSIVTIDPKSGAATVKSKLSETWKATSATTFDFNPVADRLRLMNAEGTSLRINVDDGKATVDGSHKYAAAMAGKAPKVIAGGYTNSMKGAAATALYNVDAASGMLVMQSPPNDGVLVDVGPLGVPVTGAAAFNIVATAPDQNAAWLVADGSLYSVDLKTGKATLAGTISGLNGMLSDIAWLD